MKINLDHIDHPNTKRVTVFLSFLKEDVMLVPFDWKGLKQVDRIVDACRFTSTSSKPLLTITVFFFNSYFEANDFAEVNAFATHENENWGVNGDLLFTVACAERVRLSNVLSVFAGEE